MWTPNAHPLSQLLTRGHRDEATFGDDEPQDTYDPEAVEFGEEEIEHRADDDDAENDHVIVSGDPNAAANLGKGSGKSSHRDKKIPNDQRLTTPFMTKYERARILGTRALQIR